MEYRISKNIMWFGWHRLLPALFLVIPFAATSINTQHLRVGGSDPSMILAVLILTALVFALFLAREPTKMLLEQNCLVVSGFCYRKVIPYRDLQSILTPPYSAHGLFEVTFSINGSVGSIKMLDCPNAKVFRDALCSAVPRIQCYGD
jgi:membrane protein YdbS with pleckstrin-like domain